MKIPEGLPTKQIQFGSYISPLGHPVPGTIQVGFEKPMLHVPSGDVITTDKDSIRLNSSGIVIITVPITVTSDMRTVPGGQYNQPLTIEVKVRGYRPGHVNVEIREDSPDLINFEQMMRYEDGQPLPIVSMVGVTSLAGLTGAVSAGDLAEIVGPMVPVTISEEMRLQIVADAVDSVHESLIPDVDLTVLFENSLV